MPRLNRSVRRGVLLRAAAVSAVVALGGQASAQGVLPDEMISNPQLSDTQTATIQAYVDGLAAGLTSGDAELSRDARDTALEPLEADEVSVDFRIKYSTAMLPTLRRMLASAQPAQRLTGLRLAGELATEDSADLVVAALGAREASERYMAVSSVGRIFRAATQQPPAVAGARLNRLIDDLDELIRAEQDAAIVDAGARALLDAAAIPDAVIEGVSRRADTALYAALSDRVRNADAAEPALMAAAMRAMESAQRRILGDGLARPLTAAAAGLAGDAVAMLMRTGATSESAAQLAGAADALVVFATESLDPAAQINALNLAPAVEGGRLEQVAPRLIGPGGVLTRPPHSLPADRFGN